MSTRPNNRSKTEEAPSAWRAYLPAIFSFVLLLGGIAIDQLAPQWWVQPWWRLVWYLVTYLPVGLPVLVKALKAIAKGDVFSEFFLMSLATIGAFFIKEYPEGVAVMLFSRRTAVREELTGDFGAVEREIRQAVRGQSLGSGTVINGSIIDAAHYLGRQPVRGRRAILILTDNQSLNYQVPDEDAIKALWEADSVLNAIVTGRLATPSASCRSRSAGRSAITKWTPFPAHRSTSETIAATSASAAPSRATWRPG